MVQSKRTFVKSAGCSICGLLLSPPPLQAELAAPPAHGCIVWDIDTKEKKITFLAESTQAFSRRTTGNPELDLALDHAIKRLADTFNAYPGFGFYDDSDWPNALAMPRPLLPNTKYTVLFGERYFRKWMDYDPVGVTVLAVIAHEFGHVLQFASGKYDQIHGNIPTSKRIELHADFMAGFYLGLLKRQNPNASFWRAGDQFRQIGTYDDKDPNFHGTPEDRVAASNAGFRISFVERRSTQAAFDVGMEYVSTL